MSFTNVEIKARCEQQNKMREILISQNADFKGADHQIDTYFRTSHGRLKLREGNIENHLIYYEREDERGPKESNIILFRTEPGTELKEMLTRSMGVLVVVDKIREIYFLDNVKFHIDVVKGLGSFVEIEAIDKQGTIGRRKLQEQCQKYLELLGIEAEDLVSNSYSDMLLENRSKR